jgi:hypothetical protein
MLIAAIEQLRDGSIGVERSGGDSRVRLASARDRAAACRSTAYRIAQQRAIDRPVGNPPPRCGVFRQRLVPRPVRTITGIS